jgi:hypothetical protein
VPSAGPRDQHPNTSRDAAQGDATSLCANQSNATRGSRCIAHDVNQNALASDAPGQRGRSPHRRLRVETGPLGDPAPPPRTACRAGAVDGPGAPPTGAPERARPAGRQGLSEGWYGWEEGTQHRDSAHNAMLHTYSESMGAPLQPRRIPAYSCRLAPLTPPPFHGIDCVMKSRGCRKGRKYNVARRRVTQLPTDV